MTHGRLLALTASAGLLAGSMALSIPAANAAESDTDRGRSASAPHGHAHGHDHGQRGRSASAPHGKAKGHDSMQANRGQSKDVALHAQLHELNGSGATGTASAVVRNQKIEHISVHAQGLAPTGADAPHAMHIHYGEQARNECPTLGRDDANGNGLLNTVEGLPAYGPIVVSLTTSGDTSPASALAVSRFPVANERGMLSYSRSGIEFTDVAGTGYPGGDGSGTGTAKQIADAVRDGEGVVVIHGVDLNGNGMYDFEAAGASELDPAFPQEATAPAACGVLERVR